jgi:hypothetical protein
MKKYKLFVVVDTGKKENRYMSGVIIGRITPMNITTCNFYTYKSVNLKDIKNIDSFVSIEKYLTCNMSSIPYAVWLSKNIAKQTKTILKYNRIWVETSKSFIVKE